MWQLTTAKLKELEAIFPDVWISEYDKKIAKFAEDLNEYYRIHNRYPTSHSKIKKDRALAVMIRTQKERFIQGLMTEHQKKIVESINNWSWLKKFPDRWRNNCESTIEFANKHGRYPIKRSFDPNEARLGIWVLRQRAKYFDGYIREGKIYKLENWQREKLEQIPNWPYGFEGIDHKIKNRLQKVAA